MEGNDKSEQMNERLAQEFKQDPLYKLITKLDLLDDLFDEYMGSLREGVDYTTTEFEAWYCEQKETVDYLGTGSTMRSWQKSLNTYIEARMSGRTVFMDYQSVFRLKMALLLRKANVKLSRVSELVGLVNSAHIRVIEDGFNMEETALVDPFAGSDERREAFSAYIDKLVEDKLNSKLLLMPSNEDVLETFRSETEQIRTDLSSNINTVAQQLTEIQKLMESDEERDKVRELVQDMRKDVETRDKILMEQTKKLIDDKRLKLEEKEEMRRDIYNSMPFFVKWFMKKE